MPSNDRASLNDSMAEDQSRLFDSYADDYADTVNAVITASGETVDFFARYKARLTRRFLRGDSAPRRILDFGCGIGYASRALRAEFPSAQLVGCDISARSLGAASKTSQDGTFVAHDNAGLPFADDLFHLIFTSCVFHHIERRKHKFWISEIQRVLSSGARLVLFEHNPYNPLTRRVVRMCPFDEGVTLLKASYVTRLLKSTGFKTSGPFYYFFFPRTLSFCRRLEPFLNWLPLGAQYFVVGRCPNGGAMKLR